MTGPTTITINLYAGLRDLAGTHRLEIPFAPGSSIDLIPPVAGG